MEKLYKDEYVDIIDYDIFREKLCKGTLNIDKNDIKKYTCYQHAIIKFLETTRPNTMVFRMIAKFYEDFYEYPYLFANSPLLKNEVIEKYADQTEKDKIKKFNNSYYNATVITQLTDEFFKRELSEDEKNKFFSYLIRDLKNSPSFNVKSVIKHIIDKKVSVKELSDIELQFLGQYIAMYGNKDAEVLITEEHPSIKSNDTKGLITVNRDAKDIVDIEDFVYAVSSATRFSRAEKVINTDIVQQYELAIHLLFNKYLNEEDYVLYNKEYIYSSLYKYAIDKGYFDAQILLSTLGEEDLADKLLKDKMKDTLMNSSIYQKDISSKPLMLKKEEEMTYGEFPASSFITKHLDEIILHHPNELKNYPVLNKFYYEHGKRKPFNVIFETFVNDSHQSSCLYGNFLSSGINDGELNKLAIPEDKDKAYRYIDSLANLFHDKMMVLFMYLRSTSDNNKEELGYSILYQVNQLANILDLVLNNVDLITELVKENGKVNQNCLLYRFLIDFKDFDYNSITNESILDNQYVMFALVQLEVLRMDLNNKFNKAFIDERISYLSDKEKSNIVTLPNGEETSLVDYLYQEVLPNTNRNLEYVNGENKTYITTLIEALKKPNNNVKKH